MQDKTETGKCPPWCTRDHAEYDFAVSCTSESVVTGDMFGERGAVSAWLRGDRGEGTGIHAHVIRYAGGQDRSRGARVTVGHEQARGFAEFLTAFAGLAKREQREFVKGLRALADEGQL